MMKDVAKLVFKCDGYRMEGMRLYEFDNAHFEIVREMERTPMVPEWEYHMVAGEWDDGEEVFEPVTSFRVFGGRVAKALYALGEVPHVTSGYGEDMVQVEFEDDDMAGMVFVCAGDSVYAFVDGVELWNG